MTESSIDEAFFSRFGAFASGRCQAPGRINLVGEHLDYNGLPVLPMTIDRGVRLIYGPGSRGCIRLANRDARFAHVDFENGPAIPASPQGAWDNYVRAAVRSLNERLGVVDYPGMDMWVESTLPDGAGLSSSSALLVASALAYLDRLGVRLGRDLARLDLAETLAHAERGTGIAGGAMDQTVILAGDVGHAVKIDFNPLRTEPVPLPDGFRFVACDSLVKAEKSGAARGRYNEGPAACAVACAVVEGYLQSEWDPEIAIRNLGDLWLGPLCLTHEEAGEVFDKALPPGQLSFEAASRRARLGAEELRAMCPPDFSVPARGFRLRAMVRHVRTEYRRVELMRDALFEGDAEGAGAVMTESHRSCAMDYGVSCPELDALVKDALEAGALGARMTGAGFGGCTINLVPEDMVEDFADRMNESFYGGSAPRDAIVPLRAAPAAGYC